MNDFVPVYKPSFGVDEQDNSLKITTSVPQGKKRLVYFYLSLLALSFLIVLGTEVSMFNSFDKTDVIKLLLDLGSFLGLYAYIVVLTIYWGIRYTLGHVLEVTDQGITIFEGDYNYYRHKKYARAYIKNLRGSTYPLGNRGAVKFDYGSQTVICGKALEEAEANMIVQTILRKYPSLKDLES